MVVILWLLIWVLGMALGIHSVLIGSAYLLPRRVPRASWTQDGRGLLMARTLGIVLVLFGLSLIYAVCATPAGLPGRLLFKRVYLM